MIEFVNMFYFSSLNAIGGVESWLNYIARIYGKYDIAVVYKNADERQLKRLRAKVRCYRWDGNTTFRAKRLFVNYNPDIINFVEADEIIYMVHSDYMAMMKLFLFTQEYVNGITHNPKITKYVSVSEVVRKSFYEASGVLSEVCYNPISLSKPQKLVRLISAQRMSIEKGEKRIVKLVKALDAYCAKHDVIYQWDIYTNGSVSVNSPNLIIKQPILDIDRIYGSYDYLVALSDNEAFCYSVVEALMRGVSCVVTPCPVFEEIGLNENNSIQLDFDCKNIDNVVEKIFKSEFDFSYKPPKTTFDKYLVKKPTNYKVNFVDVIATIDFHDLADNTVRKMGDRWQTDEERANYLISKGLVMKGEEK